ncbi:DEAD/DEAH box helicase family protein [Nakamurella flavida]|uniref:DEAD/DEAH box helicase family protein n=1 Tax=Nakamurella flavida TaxID=363630 RepID=A0A938YGW9_9ACTN|nr:DEAD/DEAH box helicase family protein [Nakamurella flavida]MBM9477471.1 DEAD/DEAH box helicase family protein [Nakamurella flavida]MDP9777404.1 superfamily II DNA or RNA helicase [Nakamurella flavida]
MASGGSAVRSSAHPLRSIGIDESRLRPWQLVALEAYDAAHAPADPPAAVELPGGRSIPAPPRRDFLVTATPGAGKTTFALAVAARLLQRRTVDRVVVVCPTDHLRTQWADAAGGIGLVLDPGMTNAQGPVPDGAHGYVTTYAQVAGRPAIHAARCRTRRTLVILDEIHHAGDGLSWGEATAEAFDEVHRRLSLTGTPFRTRPGERIPFVGYRTDGDMLRSLADFTYGYRQALADRVVRPVVFAAYTGVSRWRNSAGEVIAASLTDSGTKAVEAAAWKTALDPTGGWVPHVIAAMDERITHLREHGMPDAAGLILASDQDAARAYATVVRRITGTKPVLILSDDPAASKRIESFRTSTARIVVCVRMISEGVDIPRAACLAWLTSYRTPLFFAQAVGRVVRARGEHESATVFLPAVRPLLALAAELEQDRDFVMMPPPKADEDPDGELVDPLDMPEQGETERIRDIVEGLESQAEFAHLLHSGRAVTATPEPTGAGPSGIGYGVAVHTGAAAPVTEQDEAYLGLPGLLTPEQTAALLARRDGDLRKRVDAAAREHALGGPDEPHEHDDEVAGWRAASALRREVNQLVSRVAARTGSPHASVHAQLRRSVPGPASAAAGPDLLERRRDHLLGLL